MSNILISLLNQYFSIISFNDKNFDKINFMGDEKTNIAKNINKIRDRIIELKNESKNIIFFYDNKEQFEEMMGDLDILEYTDKIDKSILNEVFKLHYTQNKKYMKLNSKDLNITINIYFDMQKIDIIDSKNGIEECIYSNISSENSIFKGKLTGGLKKNNNLSNNTYNGFDTFIKNIEKVLKEYQNK